MYKRVAVFCQKQTQGLGVGVIIDSGNKPYIGAVLGSSTLRLARPRGIYQRLDAVGLGPRATPCVHGCLPSMLSRRDFSSSDSRDIFMVCFSTSLKRTGVLQTLALRYMVIG